MWLALLLACSTPEAEVPAEAPAAHEAPADATPAADRVAVSMPRARAMPPMAKNSGGFFTLTNRGEATALVSAAADVSKTVELHTHVNEDGVMRMRKVEQIDIPANGETVLKPGGLHVMFIGLNDPMEAGKSFDLTLTFADGSTQVVTMPIKEIQVGGHH